MGIHVILLGLYKGLTETLKHELSGHDPSIEFHDHEVVDLAVQACQEFRQQRVLVLADARRAIPGHFSLESGLRRIWEIGSAKVYVLAHSGNLIAEALEPLCDGIRPHVHCLHLVQVFAVVAAQEDSSHATTA